MHSYTNQTNDHGRRFKLRRSDQAIPRTRRQLLTTCSRFKPQCSRKERTQLNDDGSNYDGRTKRILCMLWVAWCAHTQPKPTVATKRADRKTTVEKGSLSRIMLQPSRISNQTRLLPGYDYAKKVAFDFPSGKSRPGKQFLTLCRSVGGAY